MNPFILLTIPSEVSMLWNGSECNIRYTTLRKKKRHYNTKIIEWSNLELNSFQKGSFHSSQKLHRWSDSKCEMYDAQIDQHQHHLSIYFLIKLLSRRKMLPFIVTLPRQYPSKRSGSWDIRRPDWTDSSLQHYGLIVNEWSRMRDIRRAD